MITDPPSQDTEVTDTSGPQQAQLAEQPPDATQGYKLVEGRQQLPNPKRPHSLSPRSKEPPSTSNRFSILQEDDVDLSCDNDTIPRLILEDKQNPRVRTKKPLKSKSRIARRAQADRIIQAMKWNENIDVCLKILDADSNVVALAMHRPTEDSTVLPTLAYAHAVKRKLATVGLPCTPEELYECSPIYELKNKNPEDILIDLVDNDSACEILLALGTIDLFLLNRAPDLYSNEDAMQSLLSVPLTWWPATHTITDHSLWHLVTPTLLNFKLPSTVRKAIHLLNSVSEQIAIDALFNTESLEIRLSVNWEDVIDGM